MKTMFRSMTLPMFALVAALAGCSASGTAAAAESVGDVNAAANAVQANAHEGHHGGMHARRGHGGPDFLVHAALRAPINLTAAQRTTIEGLAKAHADKPQFDATRAAKLASAIRSNTVSATQEQNDSGREARIAAAAQTLSTLHDTLTAEQRTALVDSIEKHEGNRGERTAKRDAKGGDVRGDHKRGDQVARGGGFGGPMHMLADLELTQEQKDAIKAKLDAARPSQPTQEQREAMKARFQTMRTEMKAKLETFKAAGFDAKAFVTPPAGAQNEAHKAHVNPLAVITPVLTPAQREKLATRIEQGPKAMAPQITK